MPNLTAVTDFPSLLELLPEIAKLADSQTHARRYYSTSEIRNAILRGNLIALVDDRKHIPKLAGYILWSGIYPNAKVLHIATDTSYRGQGAGSTLVRKLVTYLKKLGFLTLWGEVPEDMALMLEFCEENEFYRLDDGDSRKTNEGRIIVLVRELRSKTLNSEPADNIVDFRIRTSASVDSPIYVLDRGDYSERARQKDHTDKARKLFSAASNNIVRLAIPNEIPLKLSKSKPERYDQEIIQLALGLPRLTNADPEELNSLRDKLHRRIFVEQNFSYANTPQSYNYASQIAHAILSRALAFVTSNKEILRSRELFINIFGIDVVSIDDLLQLLSDREQRKKHTCQQVDTMDISVPTLTEVCEYFSTKNVRESIIKEFTADSGDEIDCWRRCFRINGRVFGLVSLLIPKSPVSKCRLTIHCDEENLHRFLFADHLLDLSLREASNRGTSSIEIELPDKQPTVSAIAYAKGFNTSVLKTHSHKVVIGQPVTEKQWPKLVRETHKRTGLKLSNRMPKRDQRLSIQTESGKTIQMSQFEFEKLFAPTVVAWRDRDGVIVPIKPFYSKELLETTPPLSQDFNLNTKYFSRRTYVNNFGCASRMRVDAPIFFYESKGRQRQGAGAILAVARITSALIYPKFEEIREMTGQPVLKTENVLRTRNVVVTTFENIFWLHNPIPFVVLKSMGAADDSCLVSAKTISANLVNKIMDMGFYDH